MRTAENNNLKKETSGKLSPILITQQDAFKGLKKRSFRILFCNSYLHHARNTARHGVNEDAKEHLTI